jgi:pyruvate-formate lyase
MCCQGVKNPTSRGLSKLEDAETLRKAHENPEAYPDLIVRVAGFTAHFAVLSPATRQMVVDRVLVHSR